MSWPKLSHWTSTVTHCACHIFNWIQLFIQHHIISVPCTNPPLPTSIDYFVSTLPIRTLIQVIHRSHTLASWNYICSRPKEMPSQKFFARAYSVWPYVEFGSPGTQLVFVRGSYVYHNACLALSLPWFEAKLLDPWFPYTQRLHWKYNMQLRRGLLCSSKQHRYHCLLRPLPNQLPRCLCRCCSLLLMQLIIMSHGHSPGHMAISRNPIKCSCAKEIGEHS